MICVGISIDGPHDNEKRETPLGEDKKKKQDKTHTYVGCW